MTVEVTLTNGTVITPSFDPEHSEGVIAFYDEQTAQGTIKGYRVI